MVLSIQPFYQDESVCVYHGDCREVLPFLPKTDLLLTDPPYGGGYAADPLPVMSKGRRIVNHAPESWDNDAVPQWLLDMARASCRYQVVWGGNYYALPVARCWLSWHKPDAPPSMANVELAWTNLDRNAQQFSWSIAATNAERVGHPTQKPEAVMRWALMQAPEGCNVLDPFMGSGTTLVACKRMGRKAIGIERERRYCDIAVERLRQSSLDLTMDIPTRPEQMGVEL